MSDTKELIEKYSKPMAAYFSKRLNEIDEEIAFITAPLVKEREELMEALKAISKNETSNTNEKVSVSQVAMQYSADMSNLNKVVYITNQVGYLTVNELALQIHRREQGSDIDVIKGTLSAVLAMDAKKDEPRLLRTKNDKNKWTYMAK